MPRNTLVALKCRLSKGPFSRERTFEVKLASGEDYAGAAPRHFCWNAKGALLGEGEAGSEAGVEGLVAAKLVDELEGGLRAVEVPDGEVLAVRDDQVVERPTRI